MLVHERGNVDLYMGMNICVCNLFGDRFFFNDYSYGGGSGPNNFLLP